MDNHGARWYRMFNKSGKRYHGVMDDFRDEQIKSMKVVSAPTSKGTMMYTVFRSYIELFNYVMANDVSHRIFNERVDEFQLQKPRFDIDIDDTKPLLEGYTSMEELGEYVKDQVINGILTELGSRATLEDNILVYSSHGSKKVSYHILVAGYVVTSCHDAFGFFDKVVPNDIRLYIDASIYERNHTLRMLHCHKLHESRIKVFEEEFTYKGNKVRHKTKVDNFVSERQKQCYIFSLSLITHSSGCITLPPYSKPKEKIQAKDIDDDTCKKVVDIVSASFDMSNYEVIGVSGGLIKLRRLEEDHCVLCDRLHHPNTLPYLFRKGDEIYWSCGRPDNNGVRPRLLVGKVKYDFTMMDRIISKMEEEEDEMLHDLVGQIDDMLPSASPQKESQSVHIPPIQHHPVVNIPRRAPVEPKVSTTPSLLTPKLSVNLRYDLKKIAGLSTK